MIHEILSKGELNAKTGKEISALLGVNIRNIVAAVEKERREGWPICASSGDRPGYFLAENQGEMERYCRSLLKRAGELHKTRRACLDILPSLPAE